MFPGEDGPVAFHLAWMLDTRAVSCVTFLPEPLEDTPAWRLRGMATLAEHRGRGYGGELVEAGAAEVARRGGNLLWCNGRVAAARFYRRHGFVQRGGEFEGRSGRHYRFVRQLTVNP